jgi:hypothetical protein
MVNKKKDKAIKETKIKAIKSKKRVASHGEVFTPNDIVNDMLDLTKDTIANPVSKILEPACGNGNFLVEILLRKIKKIPENIDANEFGKNIITIFNSIYAIDLLEDNIKESKERLFKYFSKIYITRYKDSINISLLQAVKMILDKQIVQGNGFTLKKVYFDDGIYKDTDEDITFD